MHTLTYFGIHTPAALFDQDREAHKAEAVARALAALDEHLVEPIASYVATDSSGRPCIEAKVPQDVEDDLAMPGGHIFHGDLDWPWASNRARLETPAQQWGVQTDHASVMVCGSGARRGGFVSGPRRAQRRTGGAGLPVTPVTRPLPIFPCPPPRSTVAVASQRAPLAQLVEQLTLNQRVGGSSPSWRTTQKSRPVRHELDGPPLRLKGENPPGPSP